MKAAVQQSLGLESQLVMGKVVETFVLPYLPPSKNVYDGWQVTWKSGCKRKWIRDMCALIEQRDLPRGLSRVGLAARLVFPSNQRRDPQNYAATLWNFVPDALVRSGLLLDDRDGAIEWGPRFGLEFDVDTRVHRTKQQRSRTIVTVAFEVDEGHRLFPRGA